MNIRLNSRPSTDGLGVKRWTYKLDAYHTLYVFDRTTLAEPRAQKPYLLRLDHIDGRTLAVRFAVFKSEAIDRAQWLALKVARGELEGLAEGVNP